MLLRGFVIALGMFCGYVAGLGIACFRILKVGGVL
jgi:lipoprotein